MGQRLGQYDFENGTIVDFNTVCLKKALYFCFVFKIVMMRLKVLCPPNIKFATKLLVMNYDTNVKGKTMRNLRELGSTTMYGREMDGSPDQEPKYPSALLATAGLDDKIYIWHPETGDIYKEYDLDPQIDSQVSLFVSELRLYVN